MGFVSLGLGLLAGAQHAATGPDHLAGVAPFAATRGRAAWRVGAAWGLGHAAGASLVACVALALRDVWPGLEQRLSSVSELVVGGVLVVVGWVGLRAALAGRVRDVEHSHGGERHRHPVLLRDPVLRHGEGSGTACGLRGLRGHRHAPFWIGWLHGAAGLSHLFLVLPAMALPLGEALLYLLGYAGGSLATLLVFAQVLGRLAPAGSTRAPRVLLGLASAASLVVGLAWLGLNA